MKQKLFLLFFLTHLCIFLNCQDTIKKYWEFNKIDPFNNVHCPVPDGYTMWMLRQNLVASGFQTIVEYNNLYNNKLKSFSPEYRIETYIPVYKQSKFSAIAGARYWKMSLMQDNRSIDNTVQFLWSWSILQYKPSEKWNIMLSAETYQKGNEQSFHKTEGNEFFTLLYAGYAINSHWQIIGFGGFDKIWRVKGTKEKIFGAGQLKWLVNNNLKLMVGAPTLFAAEWSIARKFDIATYQKLKFESTSFLRYRFTTDASFSLIYRNMKMKCDDMYFNDKSLVMSNQTFTYNNISQRQHRIIAEFGIRFTKNTSIQINFGHILGSDTEYKLEEIVQKQNSSADGWIGGVSIYFLDL